ncbi:MAG: tetratricopeptide repeat protein [Deltaproteobacteria bacterium]|nr:tetratricopeptide repeat protein [Deltaproteobacteria bacterium]
MIRLHRFLALVLLALSPLCLSCMAGKQDIDSLRSSMYGMQQAQQAENERLNQRMDELETQFSGIRSELDRTLADSTQTVRSNQANQWAEIESLRLEVARILGRMEETQRSFSGTTRSNEVEGQRLAVLENRIKALEGRLEEIQSQLGLEREGQALVKHQDTPDVPAPASPPLIAPIPGYNSAETLYKKALESFYEKNYDAALSMWTEFVRAFPDNALVSNAIFWQGECHYQKGDFANSVLSYQKVIEEHAESNKYRPALLKQGMAFFKMGKDKAGTLVLQDLIKKFPDSVEARRAKGFLKSS